jgi:23S rRNA pseudouridine1911/1915/1917 synthase
MNRPGPQHLLIEDRFAGTRLDLFLAGHFDSASIAGARLSRAEIQRLIAEGQITLNGGRAKPSARIRANDRIDVRLAPPRDSTIRPEALPLDVLYEDADCIVINKAPGIAVHPAAGHASGTLVNALLHHCADIEGIGGERRPGIVHRLDKDTSGVMIVAKNAAAYEHLALQFKNRSVEKEYLALAWGHVRPDRGLIDRPIGRHRSDRKRMSSVHSLKKSRAALTEWAVEERFALGAVKEPRTEVTLLRLRPRTGRTHQLRVHFADLGYALVGDRVYGGKRNIPSAQLPGERALAGFSRQALHAEKLSISHPCGGGRMVFSAPLAGDLTALLSLLRGDMCEQQVMSVRRGG